MDNNQIIFYSTPDGNIKVEVIFDEDTFWLTQKAMAKLFGIEVPGISKHLSRIFETGELQEESTISILETVQKEGERKIERNVAAQQLDPSVASGVQRKEIGNPWKSVSIRAVRGENESTTVWRCAGKTIRKEGGMAGVGEPWKNDGKFANFLIDFYYFCRIEGKLADLYRYEIKENEKSF